MRKMGSRVDGTRAPFRPCREICSYLERFDQLRVFLKHHLELLRPCANDQGVSSIKAHASGRPQAPRASGALIDGKQKAKMQVLDGGRLTRSTKTEEAFSVSLSISHSTADLSLSS